MTVSCPHIDTALELARSRGNALWEVSEGWSGGTVVFMQDPLGDSAKAAIAAALPELEYWSAPGTPHDPADEGFSCNACRFHLSFPRTGSRPPRPQGPPGSGSGA